MNDALSQERYLIACCQGNSRSSLIFRSNSPNVCAVQFCDSRRGEPDWQMSRHTALYVHSIVCPRRFQKLATTRVDWIRVGAYRVQDASLGHSISLQKSYSSITSIYYCTTPSRLHCDSFIWWRFFDLCLEFLIASSHFCKPLFVHGVVQNIVQLQRIRL